MRGESLKGHLEMLLLASLEGTPRHGYSVIEELRRRSEGVFDLAEGTIYPALHRLEQSGLIKSRWTKFEGRRRRVYDLTRRGRASLAERRKDWKDFSRAVARVIASPA